MASNEMTGNDKRKLVIYKLYNGNTELIFHAHFDKAKKKMKKVSNFL